MRLRLTFSRMILEFWFYYRVKVRVFRFEFRILGLVFELVLKVFELKI